MASTPRHLWKRCMEIFRSNLNEQQYQTWFMPLGFKSYDAERKELVLSVPTQFFYEFLEAHHRKLIHYTINNVFGVDTQLAYEIEVVKGGTVQIDSQEPTSVAPTPPSTHPTTKAPMLTQAVGPAQDLDSRLDPTKTFNSFIEGTSNKIPRQIGLSIAITPGQQAFNPLFIYGHTGVGKTHLANAIGLRMKELHPEMRVLYLSAALFEIQFTDSRKNNTFNDFIYFYQSIDMLIVDDIQELMGKEKTQYAFFHIFNHLRQNGRHIIMTSDRPPTALQGMEDRLITRFQSGLLAELEQPEEKLRCDILQSKIKHDGLNIPTDVVNYISQHVSDSIRELQGVLHSLMAYSVVYNRDVDMELAERILGRSAGTSKKSLTLEQIVEDVSQHYSIRQEDVYGKSRKAEIVLVRQVSMYLAQRYTKLTSSKIGFLIGNRNHATVLHSVKAIENRIKTDKAFQKEMQEIESTFKQKV